MIKKQPLERASSLLKFFALEQRRDARATELSGGMVRRLVIARALINQPELLILDEPTTGLDPQSRHQVWEKLESLKKQGMTILLTTHYMDEAARLCDHLVIMDHGKILAQGSPQSLISEYTGNDIIEVAEPEDDLRAFSREKKVRQEDLGHRLIIYAENGHELYREICGRFTHKSCILRSATLEDVFLEINRKGVAGMNVNISTRFIRIWQRNLTVYRESWKINFLPPLLEPFFICWRSESVSAA